MKNKQILVGALGILIVLAVLMAANSKKLPWKGALIPSYSGRTVVSQKTPKTPAPAPAPPTPQLKISHYKEVAHFYQTYDHTWTPVFNVRLEAQEKDITISNIQFMVAGHTDPSIDGYPQRETALLDIAEKAKLHIYGVNDTLLTSQPRIGDILTLSRDAGKGQNGMINFNNLNQVILKGESEIWSLRLLIKDFPQTANRKVLSADLQFEPQNQGNLSNGWSISSRFESTQSPTIVINDAETEGIMYDINSAPLISEPSDRFEALNDMTGDDYEFPGRNGREVEVLITPQ